MDLIELINSVDIVEYISQFVDLEEKNGEYWGLSCFKDEKTPSFSVRKETQVFYDYSSGIGGNLFTFVKEYNKCSPSQAVEIIKKYAGYDGKVSDIQGRLPATMVWKRFAMPKKVQKDNVSSILPEDYMLRYEKQADKLAIWEHEGISKDALDKFQVYYDGFSNRLVYPIRNIDGKIVNIGGRALDPLWKEKNMRKYCYFFSWGKINTLYGISENLSSIKEKHEVIIFEGCKSVLLAYSWGITNTAAILTSHLSDSQMKILAHLGCRVVFALDKDIRIRDDKRIKKLKNYVPVEYIWDYNDLLNDKDAPVDKGKEVFVELYGQRIKWK